MDYNLHYYPTQQSGYPPPPPQPPQTMMQQPQQGYHIPISSPLPQLQQHQHHLHQPTTQANHLQQHHQTNYNQQLAPLQHSPLQTPHHDLQPSPRPSTGFSPHTPHLHQQSPHQMTPGPSPIHHQQPQLVVVAPNNHISQQQQQQQQQQSQTQIMPSRICTPQPLGVQVPSPMATQHQTFISPRRSMASYHTSPSPLLNTPHHSPSSESHSSIMHQQQPVPYHLQHQSQSQTHQHHLHQQGTPSSQSYMSNTNYNGNNVQNIHSYDKTPTVFYQNIAQTELRIIELNKRLQSRPRYRGSVSPLPSPRSSEENFWWERFTTDFFDDHAKLSIRIAPDDKPVEYSIGRTLIPKFFKSYFDGGVVDLSIKIRNAKEITSSKHILLDCDQTDITSKYNFKHSTTNMPINVVVHTEGHLMLEFANDSLLIRSWRFYTLQCHEYIDRSMTTSGAQTSYLVEPVTRQGLTTTTVSYLKMCMIMEPMQELMFLHKQSQMNPRACLKHFLFEKYKHKSHDDKPQPVERKKRRVNNSGANANKKTKSNSVVNNNIINGTNNNSIPTTPVKVSTLNSSGPTNEHANCNESMQKPMIASNENENKSPTINHTANDKSETCNSAENNEIGSEVCELVNSLAKVEQTTQDSVHENDCQIVKTNDLMRNNNENYPICNIESIIVEETNDNDVINAENIKANKEITSIHDTIFKDNPNQSKLSEQEAPISDKKCKPITNGDSDKATPVDETKKVEKKIKDESKKSIELKKSKDETVEKENNSSLNEDLKINIVENKSNSCDPISKPSPSSNGKTALTTIKQNRRRSSERKETLREGLMRTSDFVVAMKDLKCEHPALWRITTGNNLLQQFEPKTKDGIVLYENTNQYAGWNPEIKKEYVGVDVKLTQHTRNQITVEKLLLNFQKIEDAESFYDKHFVIYLQIIISTALDPKFWEYIEKEPEHHDYFITSRRIIDDIAKQYKLKLSNKLQLSGITLKNIEKYPNLLLKQVNKNDKDKLCRACNIHISTQILSFEDRSYDLHSYKPVKLSNESTKSEENNLCEACLDLVKLYSQIHHLGWKLYNLCKDKIDQYRTKIKPINLILDDCLKDEDWLTLIYAERDELWSRVQQIS